MTTPLLELEGTWARMPHRSQTLLARNCASSCILPKKIVPQRPIPVPLRRSWRRLAATIPPAELC